MAQHPNVKKRGSGSHLDQHPAVKQKTSGSHLDQHPNVGMHSSGSHLEQHPNVMAGNMGHSDHLTPVHEQVAGPRTVERSGHSRQGHVRSKPATSQKPGPKFVAERIV